MGDAEQANIDRTLKNIDNSLKGLVLAMTAINENLVIVGKIVNAWFESIEDISVQTVPPKADPKVWPQDAALKDKLNKEV